MANASEKTPVDESQFEWLQLKREVDSQLQIETTEDKFKRKFKENPLVPIGAAATFGALSFGLWSLKTKQRQMSQYMMRLRIGAQGFTIVAMMVGIGMAATKGK